MTEVIMQTLTNDCSKDKKLVAPPTPKYTVGQKSYVTWATTPPPPKCDACGQSNWSDYDPDTASIVMQTRVHEIDKIRLEASESTEWHVMYHLPGHQIDNGWVEESEIRINEQDAITHLEKLLKESSTEK